MRVMAIERSVNPPEHPAIRMARLRSVDGDILTRFEFGGVMYRQGWVIMDVERVETKSSGMVRNLSAI